MQTPSLQVAYGSSSPDHHGYREGEMRRALDVQSHFPASDRPILKSAIQADKDGKGDERLRASATEDDYDKLQDTNVARFLELSG